MLSEARTITLATAVIQAAGFGKTLLIAYLFGAAVELDGYYLALVLPSLLVSILAGSLQGGFVATYVSLHDSDGGSRADELASQLFVILLSALGALTAALYVFTQPIVSLVVLSDDPTLLEATYQAFRIVLFVLLLNATADYFCLILNGRKRFALAAFSPLVNVLVSTAILASWAQGGQAALTYGLLAGVAAQVVVTLAGLLTAGVKLRLAWPRYSQDLRQVAALIGTMAAGVLLATINSAVDQVMASLAGPGSVSLLGYASRFHGLITQLLIVGVGTVLLPHLASLLQSDSHAAIRSTYADLFWPLACAAAVVPVGVMLTAHPILGALMGTGQLSESDIREIATIWFWYSTGLLPMAWGIYLSRYFQSIKVLGLITRLAAFSVLANVVLNLIFIRAVGLPGLAISTSLVYLGTAVAYHLSFRRQTGFRLGADGWKLATMTGIVAIYLFMTFPTAIAAPNAWQVALGATIALACTGMWLASITGRTRHR